MMITTALLLLGAAGTSVAAATPAELQGTWAADRGLVTPEGEDLVECLTLHPDGSPEIVVAVSGEPRMRLRGTWAVESEHLRIRNAESRYDEELRLELESGTLTIHYENPGRNRELPVRYRRVLLVPLGCTGWPANEAGAPGAAAPRP